jgi:hypothetical protein
MNTLDRKEDVARLKLRLAEAAKAGKSGIVDWEVRRAGESNRELHDYLQTFGLDAEILLHPSSFSFWELRIPAAHT